MFQNERRQAMNIPDATIARLQERVINRDALVARRRTEAQVQDVVRSLNRKLAKLTSWRGHSITLYTLKAALADGVIVVRMTEPDRTMTGQPDRVWAEEFLDVNTSAVALYRHAKVTYLEGMGRAAAASWAEYERTNQALNGK